MIDMSSERFRKKIKTEPSLWMINDELGIHYPNEDKTLFFDNQIKKWCKSPWKTSNILFWLGEEEFVSFL